MKLLFQMFFSLLSVLIFSKYSFSIETEIIPDYGVQFIIPKELSEKADVEGAHSARFDSKKTVQFFTQLIPQSSDIINASIEELKNTSASRSFLDSYGTKQVALIKQASNYECSFDGLPIDTAGKGSVIRYKVKINCPGPEEFEIEQRLIRIQTTKGIVFLRLDFNESSKFLGEKLFDEIFNSININIGNQVNADTKIDPNKTTSGGNKFRFVDYSRIKTSYLVGSYIGTIFGYALFGYFITLLLLKLKLSFLLSLIISQVITGLIYLTSALLEGNYEADPLKHGLSIVLAVFIINSEIRRRKTKQESSNILNNDNIIKHKPERRYKFLFVMLCLIIFGGSIYLVKNINFGKNKHKNYLYLNLSSGMTKLEVRRILEIDFITFDEMKEFYDKKDYNRKNDFNNDFDIDDFTGRVGELILTPGLQKKRSIEFAVLPVLDELGFTEFYFYEDRLYRIVISLFFYAKEDATQKGNEIFNKLKLEYKNIEKEAVGEEILPGAFALSQKRDTVDVRFFVNSNGKEIIISYEDYSVLYDAISSQKKLSKTKL